MGDVLQLPEDKESVVQLCGKTLLLFVVAAWVGLGWLWHILLRCNSAIFDVRIVNAHNTRPWNGYVAVDSFPRSSLQQCAV